MYMYVYNLWALLVNSIETLLPPNPPLQCFGLLGVNGAGKTTTFRMLTGDTAATGGDAIIASRPVSESMGPMHQWFGYCPQVDALIDPLTGRQHLTLYCKLRGLPPAEVRREGEWEGESERERERDRQRVRSVYSWGYWELHNIMLVLIDPWDSCVSRIHKRTCIIIIMLIIMCQF